MDDPLLLVVARPGDVDLARLERRADRVHARHELPVAEHLESRSAGPGHDAHAQGDVGRVGDLHADVGERRAERAHAEGHHVHRPAPHRAREQLPEAGPHLRRVLPVVGRPGVGLAFGAHEGPVLDAGDVARVGCRPVRAGALGRIELDERARLDQLLAQQLVLLVCPFEPVDGIRLAEGDHLVHPPQEPLIPSGWGVQRDGHNADSLRGNGSNRLPAAAQTGLTVALCTPEDPGACGDTARLTPAAQRSGRTS